MNLPNSEEIKILPTKLWGATKPTAILKNKYIHSKYDPEREAKKILSQYSNIDEYDLIIIFGIGLGYILEHIIAQNPNVPIVIVEKEPFFAEYIQNKFDSPNLKIFINEEPENIIKFFSKNIIITNLKNVAFIQNEALNQIYYEYYNKVKSEIIAYFKRNVAEITTDAYFSELWVKNIIKNLKNLKNFGFIRDYKDIFKDEAGILISAGPSIEKNVSLLKKTDLYKFAVAPAVNFLLKNGVVPDFVIASDASYYNLFHFKRYIKNDALTLITELSIHPAVLSNWKGKIILFDFNLSPSQILKEIAGEIGYIPMGGTISISALFIMKYLGFKTIFLMGQDFGYIDFKTHCKATGYELYNINRISKFKSILSYNYEQIKDNKIQYRNDRWLTDTKMEMYKKWLEEILNDLKIEIKNLSQSEIKGIPKVTDTEIYRIKQHKKDFIYKSYNFSKDLKISAERMLQKLYVIEKGLNKILKTKQFSNIQELIISEKQIYELIRMVLYIEFLKLRRGIQKINEEFIRKLISGIQILENLFIIFRNR